jgi:hypothetical protein
MSNIVANLARLSRTANRMRLENTSCEEALASQQPPFTELGRQPTTHFRCLYFMSGTSQSLGFPQTIDQCKQQSDPVSNVEDLAKGVSAGHLNLPEVGIHVIERTSAISRTLSLVRNFFRFTQNLRPLVLATQMKKKMWLNQSHDWWFSRVMLVSRLPEGSFIACSCCDMS